jgi:hypothetical protein
MIAGLITLQQGQGARGGKAVEGYGQAVPAAAIRLERHLPIEQAGFDGPGAALAPVSGAHFLDHAELDFVGGLEAVDVLLEENQEVLARFVV